MRLSSATSLFRLLTRVHLRPFDVAQGLFGQGFGGCEAAFASASAWKGYGSVATAVAAMGEPVPISSVAAQL